MTSLQKAYEYIKSSPKLLLLCDLYVQISLFLMVGLLGLGVLGLVFDGSIVGLLVAVCITCPFVLQFYSLYKKKKTLFAVCSLIILGIYFFGSILIFVEAIRSDGLLDFLFPIVCCLIVAACNSFFWHYRRNDSVSNDRFRTFVMLELGFLHFLLMSYFFYFFANGTVAFLVVFELCTLLYIVAHKMFPPLKNLRICTAWLVPHSKAKKSAKHTIHTYLPKRVRVCTIISLVSSFFTLLQRLFFG